jgi:2,5-dioxopentanoate dehydrogenase
MSASTFTPHGRHLRARRTTSRSAPRPMSTPPPRGRGGLRSYGYSSREERAAFLDASPTRSRRAGRADHRHRHPGDRPAAARLEGERGRTTGQLRLFASTSARATISTAATTRRCPTAAAAPRPDLKLVQRPIGPVAVFGASNFPLAFSTAGGDTAAALAAGCPVVVKGHSAHPGTGEIVAQAIDAAIEACGHATPASSRLIQGGRRDVGEALVQHPLIKAVGFTGSLAGGRALFDLCAAAPRADPVLRRAGLGEPDVPAARRAEAARGGRSPGWAGSLTMGAGQFCTNPGIAVPSTARTPMPSSRQRRRRLGPSARRPC